MRLNFTHILALIFLVFIFVIIVYTIGFKDTYTGPDDSKLLFIHIPKNAGSYVEKVFNENGIMLGKYDDRLKVNPDKPLTEDVNCAFWHIPPKYNKNIDFSKYTSFVILRDPISRIVSEYNYNKKHITNRLKQLFSINKEDINIWIDKTLTEPKDKNFENDCHLLPQTEYLTDAYGNTISNILMMETLDDDLEKLLKDNGYNINLKKEKDNVSNHEITVDDLTPKSIAKIKQYYKYDFDLINYVKLSRNKM